MMMMMMMMMVMEVMQGEDHLSLSSFDPI